MDILKKGIDENIRDYKKRLFDNKDLYNLNCQEIADLINAETGDNFSESTYRKWYAPFSEGFNIGYEQGFDDGNNGNDEEFLLKIETAKEEVKKERFKNQTILTHLNKSLRIEARDELIEEQIIDAIKNIKPLEIPRVIIDNTNKKTRGVLCFADAHAGCEFVIKGLMGEVINSYNWDIFTNRMWQLLEETIKIVKKENFSEIDIFDCGDSISGLLRFSQLQILQKGVVESTIDYSEFLANWLNELSKTVKIKYHAVMGNHESLRLLNGEKGLFPKENMFYIINKFLQIRLESNMNIKFVNNQVDKIYTDVCGYSVLGVHGEVKNPIQFIKDFSIAYRVLVNYIICGHYHHLKTEDVARDSEIISIPSIIGIDEYAMGLLRTSNAGALFLVFEENKGKAIEYKIKLN